MSSVTSDAFEAAWRRLPRPARERGRVERIVLRLGGGEHAVPERVEVDVEAGVVGDRWSLAGDPDRLCQVTLMMAPVARLVAGDEPRQLSGDNFLVDFDLGEEALPAGARVHVGAALLEVTGEPHLGCKIFRERFGAGALRWVNLKEHRSRRLRGVNCRVIEGGSVALGDLVERA